jgi:hypothetical protein
VVCYGVWSAVFGVEVLWNVAGAEGDTPVSV